MIFKIIIFIFFGISLFLQSELLLLISSIIYCLRYITDDFWLFRVNRLDISSVYTIGLLLNTISHLIAITATDVVTKKNYLLHYAPEHLFMALAVFHIGSVVIMETFRFKVPPKFFNSGEIIGVLKQSRWDIMLFSGICFFIINKFTGLSSFGSIGTILALLEMGAVLYLSIYAHYTNEQSKINIVLILVLFLSFWALRFSYLRYEIILPWVSYFFGEAIARKKIKLFSVQSKIILVLLIIVIPPVFTYLGKNRETVTGRADKISIVITGVKEDQQKLEEGQTIMSRLSYINQLTHVVKLTSKNGFYEGKTLQYFAYVFIPRFVWPDKPTIQQGQWFALESGLALRLKGGRVNNSINMTVPGEFYLNFGWPGVLIGCWLFALFIVFIWKGILGQNLLSLGLQFYLLFGSMAGLGADLQIVVTLLAYYLIYKIYILVTSQNAGVVHGNA